MIRLPDAPLALAAKTQLRGWQSAIDRLTGYDARVAEAARRFKQRNTATNTTFKAVRASLDTMCSGGRRCAYCEDSAADEVEHVSPKALYPEACFRWENYVYACGPCNGPKNNHFAVFVGPVGPAPRTVVEVSRREGDPIVPPIAGDPVLPNPRREDPLALLHLDMKRTFFFVSRASKGTEDYERAEYTIRILKLNLRDYLPRQRREYHGNYLARLKDYVRTEQAGGEAARRKLVRIAAWIQGMAHPSVWSEMKRQHRAFPELARLFGQSPDALRF